MARVSFHIFLHCVFGPQTDKPSVVEKGGEERGAGDGGAEFRNKTKGKMMKCGQPNPVQGRKNRKSLTKGSKEREERERERERRERHTTEQQRGSDRETIYILAESEKRRDIINGSVAPLSHRLVSPGLVARLFLRSLVFGRSGHVESEEKIRNIQNKRTRRKKAKPEEPKEVFPRRSISSKEASPPPPKKNQARHASCCCCCCSRS
jgi:hypothetical protein